MVAGVTDSQPTVGYSLDLRLGYYDELRNPFSGRGDGSSKVGRSGGGERTLGLTKARGTIWWWLPAQSRLSLVLRPDALTDSEERQEYDSRAGEVYRQRPVIKVLDAYKIEKQFGEQLAVGVGVTEKLAMRHLAYDSLLEFGLEVQMPQRTSNLEVEWRNLGFKPHTAQQQVASGYTVNFKVFQGDKDRAEARRFSDESYDQAPASEDPHYGVVAGVERVDGHVNRVGILVGQSDNGYKETDDNGVVTVTGKRNEVFGQLYGDLNFLKWRFPTRFGIEYRVMKEQWKGDKLKIQPRTHQSISLTSSVQLQEDQWSLIGGHFGKSQYNDVAEVNGYQIDVGYKQVFAKTLWLTFMITEEHREQKVSGATSGGFVKTNGDDTKVLRRFALEVAYLLGQG